MDIKFTMTFQKVPEGYIGFVEELPGANSQGETMEETKSNLLEAIELILEANRAIFHSDYDKEIYIQESMALTLA
jgi:predicted RNase H-like HicB family nuclease